MSVDWNALITLEQWAEVLHELLAEARASILSGDTAKRDLAHKTLVEFVMESPNSIAIELDEFARGAIDAIKLPARDQAAASVANHMAEVAKYLKK